MAIVILVFGEITIFRREGGVLNYKLPDYFVK